MEDTELMSDVRSEHIKIHIKGLNFYYGKNYTLKAINIAIKEKAITALIGPSGCGKTTFLRCLNRMHDIYPDNRYQGEIIMDGKNILDKDIDLIRLRSRVGMVFQKPTPFPTSIFENIAFGLRLRGIRDKSALSERVVKALEEAALYNEVKDSLKKSALSLSGGQQQRLCIARAIAVKPEVMLFDEPSSALDPIATSKIEELIHKLKQEYTVVIVTHNMQQAARVSDFTGFFMMGKLIEFDKTDIIFTNPSNRLTEEYITGRFG